jgi:hypothetical protein
MLYSPSLRLRRWRDHGADADVFYRVRRDVQCCLAVSRWSARADSDGHIRSLRESD